MSVKTKKKFDITNYTSLLSSLIAIVGGLVMLRRLWKRRR